MIAHPRRISVLLTIILSFLGHCNGGAAEELEVPQVKDGQTQEIEEFKDPDLWIRHDLWVETEFDSDRDGRLDRMHVDVTRPRQTDSLGIKLPGAGFGKLRTTHRTVADEAGDLNARRLIMGHDIEGIESHYVKRISDERLRKVTDHVYRWLFG